MSFPGIIGKKRGMTQVFDENGFAVGVTVVELIPLVITQIKTPENDGYAAIQVGYDDAKAKHLSKAEQKHLEKNGIALKRHLKEYRVSVAELANYKVGDTIDPVAEGSFLLAENQLVDATGTSIGKGFQGGTKMWNQHRGLMSHGSKSHRLPGSIGAGTTPGRVFKGLKMARNMGNERVTTSNLSVVRVITENDMKVVLIKGSVPGVEGGTVFLRPKRAKWNAVKAS